jgi:hypothetical protein
VTGALRKLIAGVIEWLTRVGNGGVGSALSCVLDQIAAEAQ